MNFTARADRSAKAGCNFVIAQIDVSAASRTVCRYCRVADLVFAFALKAGNDTSSLLVPKPL
ncbi:MAG TPA: hypothetical protein DCO65_04335 [Spartobacteria bacterium]|nr:hypothetical protein [Spartobacteria bacterium]